MSNDPDNEQSATSLTRRRLIQRGLQGAVVVGGLDALAACGGSSSTSSQTASPKRGGTFTLGMITGGSAESLNPAIAFTGGYADIARVSQLFDGLLDPGPDVRTLAPRLAVSWEPNSDATTWTFHLRGGVHWHDGKPFTAQDVVYTAKSWANPKTLAYPFVSGILNFKQVRALDPLTVEMPLLIGAAEFPSLLAVYDCKIIQDGTTDADLATKPIGTGPFKFESFTPGHQSVFVANRDYWETGKPYVDRVVINSTFTDETTRLNALLSGSTNVNPVAPSGIAHSQVNNSSVSILHAHAPNQYVLAMRAGPGPFADVRVRQAMKLIPDRAALVADAFSGYGTPGNDLLGLFTTYYNDSHRATQDIEQARSLLKAAGQENLTVSLATSQAGTNYVELATLFSQQAKAAGVTVIVDQLPPATYFTSAAGYLTTRRFGVDSTITWPSMTAVARAWYYTAGLYNEDQTPTAASDKVLAEAVAETNPTRAQQLWNQVQDHVVTQSGLIVPVNGDYIDMTSSAVRGLTASAALNLNNFRLLDGWLT